MIVRVDVALSLLALGFLACSAPESTEQPAAPASAAQVVIDPSDPAVTAEVAANVTGFVAKAVCSGAFVSDREIDERFVAEDLVLVSGLGQAVSWSIDRAGQRVVAELEHGGDSFRREAVFHPTHGCTQLRPGASDVDFDVSPIERTPFDAGAPWPLGDAVGKPPAGIDSAAIDSALERAFDNSAAINTRAVVVIYGGQLVGERYAEGFESAERADRLVDGQEPDRGDDGGRGPARLGSSSTSRRRCPNGRPKAMRARPSECATCCR